MVAMADEEGEESEEAVGVRVRDRVVRPPSDAEIRAHSRTHLPFRSWCNHCVAGRAPNLPHKSIAREVLREEVSFDYCFLKDFVGGDSQSVIVGKDRRTGIIVAHVVPSKGASVEWLVPQLVRDLQKMGYYGMVTLKTDQEPAIRDLMKEVAQARGEVRTVLEASPPGESQANGHAERAIRSVEEIVRVHKLALEARVGEKLPVTHAVIPWLVEHAADLANKCMMGKDGRTGYERLKGKGSRGEILEFGSMVMLRLAGKVQGGLMQERWVEGIWLGVRFHTGEHIVARLSDGQVVRTRAVRELPRKTRREDLDVVKGQPHAPAGVQSYQVDPAKVDVQRALDDPSIVASDAGEVIFQPRSVRLTKEMFLRLGYTPGCLKCHGLQTSVWQGTLGHTPKCRIRMERLLTEDAEFGAKLRAAEERKTRYMAHTVEQADKAAQAASARMAESPGETSSASSGASAPTSSATGSASSSSGLGGSPSTGPGSHTGPTEGEGRPDVGAKRKAEDDADDSARGDQEIPLPEASADMNCSSGASSKRSREDESDERQATRMRLEMLVRVSHGGTSGDEEREIRALMIVAAPQGQASEYPLALDAGGAEWSSICRDVDWTGRWGAAGADGMTEESFDPKLVAEAKKKEYETLQERGTYIVVDRADMLSDPEAIKVSTKWVVTNKGSRTKPEMKARFVAREFVSGDIDKDTLYAATPGLSAMRVLLSKLATIPSSGVRCGMILDVKGAFLYGDAERRVYVELPDCDPNAKCGDKVGLIQRALYGTRDAPQLWQKHARKTLIALGFIESVVSPSVYYHPIRDIELSVHVDDFLCVGEEADLAWARDALAKSYTLKSTIFGPGGDHAKEVQYLGRTIRWTDAGVEIEGNAKHAQDLMECLGMTQCRGVNTPLTAEDLKAKGEKTSGGDNEEMRVEEQEKRNVLIGAEASRHRRCVAIIVYMAQDRPDLCVAACHLARSMSCPTMDDHVKLKRVVRYISSHRRCVNLFRFQAETQKVDLLTDSDWANDSRTRKSHSGGAIMIGTHMVAHWSRIQPVVALSSGEAELYACVAGLSRFLGVVNMLRDIRGQDWGDLTHKVDAAACKGILLRRGAGGVKHLETKFLWVQEAIQTKHIKVEKIPRELNISDALASFSPGPDLERKLRMMGCECRQ